LTSSDGQVVNLNLADPNLRTWFNVMQNGPGFSNFIVYPTLTQPVTLSMQMIIVAPNLPSFIGLSLPNRLVVQ
jgi:hypothetical protein